MPFNLGRCLLEVKNTNAGARETVVTLGSAGMLQILSGEPVLVIRHNVRIFCGRPLIKIEREKRFLKEPTTLF